MEDIDYLKKYLSEENIANIFNTYNNVCVIKIESDEQGTNHLLGKLLSKVNVSEKKDKSNLQLECWVRFKNNLIMWQYENICIVNIYYVKLFDYKKSIKFEVPVKVQKYSKEKQCYITETELMNLTYDQFIKRRMIEEMGGVSFAIIEGYMNFRNRKTKVGYNRAVNETCKHYFIDSEEFKLKVIPTIANFLKACKKEWLDIRDKYFENKFVPEYFTELNETKQAKILPFKQRKNA